jgi:oligoendopeptidase F
VIEGLSVLGEEYGRVLRQAYEERWIDVYENRGKSTGAFCGGCFDAHPYVLLNYEEGLSETLTIAHEMGHAMHSHYSARTQPYAKAHYEIFVAEVASTVNEVLVLRHLLGKHTHRKERASLINHLLEHFR